MERVSIEAELKAKKSPSNLLRKGFSELPSEKLAEIAGDFRFMRQSLTGDDRDVNREFPPPDSSLGRWDRRN